MYAIKPWKAKKSHYRPGQALKLPRVRGSQISWQSAYEGDKVVCLTHRPPFYYRMSRPPRAILRPEEFCQWKFPITPSGTETATFRLVAQCLNQLRHCKMHTTALCNLQLKHQNSNIFWDVKVHLQGENIAIEYVLNMNFTLVYNFVYIKIIFMFTFLIILFIEHEFYSCLWFCLHKNYIYVYLFNYFVYWTWILLLFIHLFT